MSELLKDQVKLTFDRPMQQQQQQQQQQQANMINHRRRVAFDGAADRDGFILRDSINRRLVIVAHGHIWIKLWDIFQICNRLRRCFLRLTHIQMIVRVTGSDSASSLKLR